MKIHLLMSFVVSAVGSSLAIAAPLDGDPGSKQLQIYPKNLARQHIGSNLLAFNPANQTYVPTEAAAAWLDDDVSTGWPTAQGKSYYILALPEPELMTNFSVSARNTSGSVNLWAGDEPASPTAKSWTLVAKDIEVSAINQKKMEKPFSRFAKYLLIETDLKEAGPLYSLYLFGERPSVSYHLQKRDRSVDMRSLFGSFANPQTSINLSGLYSKARVVNSNSADGFLPWQKLVDDNPESTVSIAPSTSQPGMVIRYAEPQSVGRVSVLADPSAKGRLEFFVINETAASVNKTPAETASTGSEYIKASNPTAPAAADSLDNRTPVATVTFDGNNSRGSVDFPPANGSQLVARWIPETPSQALTVREVNSFGAVSMNDYELAPEAVAELGTDNSKDGKDYKGDPIGKEPIGEFLPTKTPFTPGLPPFPPNIPLSR